MNFLKNNWPLFVSIAILWVITVVLLILSVSLNDGKLIYVLDDPYIHMAIAKNLALHGNWGVNPEQFTSTSSSPLWTLLLAAIFKISGLHETIPFIINILAATLILIFAHIIMLKNNINGRLILLGLLLLLWATPLPALIFCGMEHTLHALIALIFLVFSSRYLAGLKYHYNEPQPDDQPPSFYSILILAVLLSAIRYEGLFMIFVVCVYLFILGRLWRAVILGLVALTPPVVMGIISVIHGWYCLPNSVLLKGGFPDFSSFKGVATFFFRDVVKLFDIHVLLVLTILSLTLYILNRLTDRIKPGYHIQAIIIFMFTTWFHLQFADTGWYFRYEAYLVAIGVFSIILAISNIRIDYSLNSSAIRKPSSVIALVAAVIVAISPFFIRGGYSSYYIPVSSNNIYCQQYQMGLFLNKYYANKSVVLNDIGAVSYLTDIKTTDIWGLADKDIASSILNKQYTAKFIDSLSRARGAKVALVYDNIDRIYNAGGIPGSWRKIGQWTILNNVTCFNNTVSFYAIDNTAADDLQKQMRDYARYLPPLVKWLNTSSD